MSSYLQRHNQRLDARSKSIEGREQDSSTYMKFLEDQISKFNKREADFEKIQAKLIDIQTKFDKMLTNDVKQEAESTSRNKALSKLEEKMSSFQGLAERIDYAEQQTMNRYIGKQEFISL